MVNISLRDFCMRISSLSSTTRAILSNSLKPSVVQLTMRVICPELEHIFSKSQRRPQHCRSLSILSVIMETNISSIISHLEMVFQQCAQQANPLCDFKHRCESTDSILESNQIIMQIHRYVDSP